MALTVVCVPGSGLECRVCVFGLDCRVCAWTVVYVPRQRSTHSQFLTGGYEGEQIHMSIVGLLPWKHAKSQQLVT